MTGVKQHREIKSWPERIFSLIKGKTEECNTNASDLITESVQVQLAARQKQEVTRTSQNLLTRRLLHSWWRLPAVCHCPHVNPAQLLCYRYRHTHAACFQQELGKWHGLYRVSSKPLSKQNRAPSASVISNVSQVEKILLCWFAQERKGL